MKHVTYAATAILLDDDAADWMMEYARALGTAGMTDSVKLTGIGMDGNEVDATFLLNASTELVIQTTRNTLEGPSNNEAVGYMQERTQLILSPPPARSVDDPLEIG